MIADRIVTQLEVEKKRDVHRRNVLLVLALVYVAVNVSRSRLVSINCVMNIRNQSECNKWRLFVYINLISAPAAWTMVCSREIDTESRKMYKLRVRRTHEGICFLFLHNHNIIEIE